MPQNGTNYVFMYSVQGDTSCICAIILSVLPVRESLYPYLAKVVNFTSSLIKTSVEHNGRITMGTRKQNNA